MYRNMIQDQVRIESHPDWTDWQRETLAMVLSDNHHGRKDKMVDALHDGELVGEGVSELRINYGPGYRVYFIQRGPVLVILLCGGDKSTQNNDIKQAKVLAQEWKG